MGSVCRKVFGREGQPLFNEGSVMDITDKKRIETRLRESELAGMGCHSYQEYLFSRPLPIEECEKFIDEFANRQYGDG
jgi:predicted signal transduction protein with EAL and GGDEF domain